MYPLLGHDSQRLYLLKDLHKNIVAKPEVARIHFLTISHHFSHHRCFDFRDLSQYVQVLAPINTAQGSAHAPVTYPLFQTPEWTSTCDSDVTGSNASVLMGNSANNIYTQRNDDHMPESNTYLILRTLSLVQEADPKIRTGNPSYSIQYTNQPPNWLIDGQMVPSIQFRAPHDTSRVMFTTWSGNMSVGATAEIFPAFLGSPGKPGQNPGSGSGPSCANICSIDQTPKFGTLVLISASQDMHARGHRSQGGGQVPGGCASAKYGQCAGKTWNGCTSCAAESTC
ncbi:carbohydrate-binding module family 1 protein [Biscogniauxia sp. FL1348]|nr:carbohydrate-binding module family 1 protein [Biscogniauxia sp. FL1348]